MPIEQYARMHTLFVHETRLLYRQIYLFLMVFSSIERNGDIEYIILEVQIILQNHSIPVWACLGSTVFIIRGEY
jgi:hypothetical protein